jgi:hypothetical protein
MLSAFPNGCQDIPRSQFRGLCPQTLIGKPNARGLLIRVCSEQKLRQWDQSGLNLALLSGKLFVRGR